MSSVFSRIIAGELPARFVYRDDTVVAFLSIAPVAYGHTLVVPVAEVDRWTDLPAETWAHVAEVSQQVGRAVVEAFDCSRAGTLIAGFEVPHTHVHVFPAEDMSGFDLSAAMPMDSTDPDAMDAAARALRAALGTADQFDDQFDDARR
ncbi:HIT family protein [Corynebacterium sp. zg-331]|uniref:HIT family protein n=1 Tax=unclassified Corynebacterium TaxID=2624378 RepID=UPI00128C578E|nr:MULTISPECIES: HIT family protein [unclassified Corynebacterium]MBC3185645.1 HIT family protein [Corynebacterium sp. zg-331]MPV52139.1 HIT domain-containing protein [Corynebacterium sp. zg331]